MKDKDIITFILKPPPVPDVEVLEPKATGIYPSGQDNRRARRAKERNQSKKNRK